MAAPVIVAENLTKVYKMGEMEVYALRGLSLKIYEGEAVAVMGPSGSGKSTLMNILGCLDRPTTGSYELDGVDVASLSDDELAELRNHKLGFVFQSYNLLPRMRAVDQVAMPLFYRHAPDRDARSRAALERVGLADRMDHMPSELSGGQQQRVAIARALVTNPSVLFADEPTGNLDSRVSMEIIALLQALNEEFGVTILMVTHETDIAACAKRIIRLGDGKIIADERNEQHRARTSPAVVPPTPSGERTAA